MLSTHLEADFCIYELYLAYEDEQSFYTKAGEVFWPSLREISECKMEMST